MARPKEPQRTTYHVAPSGSGGWAVKREGAQRASALADKKQDALRAAVSLAKSQPLGQVVIHGKDGVFQKEWTYKKDPRRHRG